MQGFVHGDDGQPFNCAQKNASSGLSRRASRVLISDGWGAWSYVRKRSEAIGRRVTRYFYEGVGEQGTRVPAPPEMLGFWRFLRPMLWGLFVFLTVAFSIALFPQSVSDLGRAPRLALFAVLGAALCAFGVACVLVVVPALFWPWTRRQFGRSREAEVRGWPRRQFDEAIEKAEMEAALPRATYPAARRRYIAWLYKERERAYGVEVPARLHADLLDLSGKTGGA